MLDGGPDKIFKYIKREAESVNAKFIIIDNITGDSNLEIAVPLNDSYVGSNFAIYIFDFH